MDICPYSACSNLYLRNEIAKGVGLVEPRLNKKQGGENTVAEEEVERSRFGLYIASSLVLILLLTLALPMVFSADKETAYSAYVFESDGGIIGGNRGRILHRQYNVYTDVGQ